LTAFVRKAVPELPTDIINDMVAAKTLAENISALAAARPAIAEPGRWAGLLDCVPARMREAVDARARELGLSGLADVAGRPLMMLDMVESVAACG
jgi:hypothetical protein